MIDALIVGGGLAGSLLALRLRHTRPDATLRLVEAGARLGGEHTWSFHATDLEARQAAWIAPLVSHSWTDHEVRFPSRRRRLSGAYHTIESASFHERLAPALAGMVRLATRVDEVTAAGARLEGGERLEARLVVDARGPAPLPALRLGYQKFLGRRLALSRDHGFERPVLMDATVAQRGGYRFVYVLPLAKRELLIEDTRYDDAPELDADALRAGVAEYAQERGLEVDAVRGEETGVLPVPLSGDIEAHWQPLANGAVPFGVRAALFHPTTGYSLPEAVSAVDALLELPELTTASARRLVRERSIARWREGRFFRLLNRMLFRAARPAERYRVLERFYGLPEPLIERFYAGRLRWLDRARLVSGRPPVPLLRALPCLFGDGARA